MSKNLLMVNFVLGAKNGMTTLMVHIIAMLGNLLTRMKKN
jgi:hypothetical protein